MPTYKYTGDSPRSLPNYGIDIVSPGEVVESFYEINNPQFQLIEKKKAAAAAEKEASPEPVKEKK